jgi:hypothetical protein
LATAADRAALRCGRGAAATGVGDRNLRQHVLLKLLEIPRIKKKERRDQSFIGGDPHLSILLVDRDNIRDPLRVSAWPNEVCIK